MVALCLLCGSFLTACGNDTPEPTETETAPTQEATPMAYTVQVQTDGGLALEGVGVYVYTDETQEELVWFAKTDSEGKITFNDVESDSYIAVLSGVPEGYEFEGAYPLTGAVTTVTVGGEVSGEVDLNEVTYKLGDKVADFTVTAVDGVEYKLSELLENKKAVVLNFWYTQCQPCRNEFPYLQEAYALYQKDIAVLALNPVNADEEEIKQFQQELGLTFPMAAVDPAWEKTMELTAYPTTVVIDRFGTIAMIHKGSVTEVQPFLNMFNFFAAEDYQTTVVEKLEDLPEVKIKDTAVYDNPTEVGGVSSFQVTVKSEEVWYVDVYKVQNLYFQIKSPNVFVVYNNKAYYPNGGAVGMVINAPDTFTPVRLGIGNAGDETETFTATLGQFAGTQGNPYALELGQFSIDVSANNDQGVYFTYTAPADGELKLTCTRATGGIEYDYTLYNLNSYAYRNKGSEAVTNEDGHPVVSVKAKKGQTIQFSVGTLPDASNEYPAGSFNFLAEFVEGDGEEENDKIKQINYSITVTDENRKPMAGVFFNVNNGTENVRISTNEKGVASIKLPAGTYEATLVTPTNYEAQTTDFLLTEALPGFSVKLKCLVVVEKTYTVKILDDQGQPVANALVSVGTQFGYTDENGAISFTLPEGEYTAVILPPEGYTMDSNSYTFGDGMTEITVMVRPETEEPSESTEPSGSTEPDESTEPTEPTETTPTEPVADGYSVTVTDYNGNPKTGVVVQFQKGETVLAMVPVNDKGVAAADLEDGDYTVKLMFSGEELYYEEKGAVLTKTAPHITVQVAAAVSGEPEELSVGDAYYVGVGGTYVQMQANVVNYFLFEPTVAGNYRISTSDPEAVLSYWGGNTFFVHESTDSTDYANNSFTRNVKENNLGSTYVIGITGAEDCILEITRIGDPILDETDFPITVYEGTKEVTKYPDLPSGKSKKYVNISGKTDSVTLVLNENDGYYHVGTADGPVMYMDLSSAAPHVPLYGMMGMASIGGENITQHFYNENGELIRREQYNTLLKEYASNVDKTYGVYPLTEDLKYMIQQAGSRKGWWDVESPNYQFEDVPNLNTEIAWMFACCTVE